MSLFRREQIPTAGPHTLKTMLMHAERQVKQAHAIGWPALADSWQRDADAVRLRIEEMEWRKAA